MSRATGGVPYQRSSDGMWCVAIELPSDGTRRRRKVIVRAQREDVIRAKRAALKELARTGDLPTASPTLAAWLDAWFVRRQRKLKPRTAATYAGYIARYMNPTIGRVRLDKLTTTHVHRLHDTMLAQGLSTTTALQAHRILAKALTDAEREGRVTRNVAKLVDAPTRAAAVRPSLTAAEARALLEHIRHDEVLAPQWGVALLAGLRQGERLGITREFVDLDAGTLTVAWQLQRLKWEHGCADRRPAAGWPCERRPASCPARKVTIPADQEAKRVHGGLWLTRPKSRAGWRQVPLVGHLHHALSLHLARTPVGDEGLIFHRPDGHPIDPRDDSRQWDATLRAAGLPDVPLHSARHTANTLLHSLGVDAETRQKIMGHSSAVVNAGYVHLADAMMRDAMGELDRLLERPAIAP
jgi:integrase